MFKNLIVLSACFINRNLRYGDSKNRVYQFLVIRTRFLLKHYLTRENESVRNIGTVRIKLKHAGVMELQTNDYIDHWLYTGGDFEPHVVRLFLKYLVPGNNVIDIGSNIGYLSLISAHLIGMAGVVYSFEPSPLNFKKLKRNIELNKIRNIKVFDKAVSNKPGIAILSIPSDEIKNSGRSSLRTLEENNIKLEVETITLDSKLDEFPHIDLIKMDIEGAEAMALEGMKDLIARDQPIFIMELSDNYLTQLGSSAQEVINFFRSRNYSIFLCGEETIRLDSMENLKESQYDILCLPQAKA